MIFSSDMTKKRSPKPKTIQVQEPYVEVSPIKQEKTVPWKMIAVVALLGIAAFFYMNKSLVVAAIVNGKPIFTWQLNSALRARYGSQTLEGMIGEQLITEQARKNNITISPEGLIEKQNEILASLGGNVQLDDLLKYQGLTKEEFTNQLKMQMMVEKILTKDLVISEKDIDNYIASNRATLVATVPADMREEARKAITSNTVTEKVQAWFAEIREKAKIMKFL